MNIFHLLRRTSFVLLTLPAGVALTIAALPILTVSIDTWLAEGFLSPFVFQFTASSAQTILSTIATGAMAALSLAYSLALLVFTLAAGNIGPRLLKRFTSELVPQITAGILGGTFLYALHALLYVQDEFLPKITIAVAGLLAILSVLQLIFFVRQIANNITIDEEIAEIADNLMFDLKLQNEEDEDDDNDDVTIPEDKDLNTEIKAIKSGYLNEYNSQALIKLAHDNEFILRMDLQRGGFVTANQVIAKADKKLSDDVVNSIADAIIIESARSDDNRIEFSTRLLVEIALRALSPGVNDTYTAIAVVNSLSKAILLVSSSSKKHTVKKDQDGNVRIVYIRRSSKEIMGMAFHPLRRASTNNILMAQALAKVYTSLHEYGDATLQEIVKSHAELLLQEIDNGNHLKTDIDSVKEYLYEPLKS